MVDKNYSITQASKLTGLSESTLRYYESIRLVDPVGRHENNNRRFYTQADIEKLIAVSCLNATGMSIENMRSYMKNNSDGIEGAKQQIELLSNQDLVLEQQEKDLAIRREYIATKTKYWKAVISGDQEVVEKIAKEAEQIALQLNPKKEIEE